MFTSLLGSGVFSLRSTQFSDQMASESSKIESRLNDWPLIVTEKYQNILKTTTPLPCKFNLQMYGMFNPIDVHHSVEDHL